MKHFLLFFLLFTTGVFAQSKTVDTLPEYTLKAAYVYNFALLAEWPPQKDGDDFTVCLFGDYAFNNAFVALEQKRIENHSIKIRQIKARSDLSSCYILFLSKHEHKHNQSILKSVVEEPILTVTDDEELAQAHIQILQHNERLVFSINLGALQKSNLTLSSRLLRLAKEVTP
jgi:hypothetical protein